MDDVLSEDRMRETEKNKLDNFVKLLPEGPDLGVNKSIKRFTSLASSENLRQHYQKRKIETDNPGLFRGWTGFMVNLTSGPELAGLGALAAAAWMDQFFTSPPEECVKKALLCLNAVGLEVGNLISSSLVNSFPYMIKNRQLGDLEQNECQLSTALTKLKNSMLRDGNMTCQALKAWVNRAAFHIQILIHLVRLGENQTCDPVEKILSVYQSDLDQLFNKHREVMEAKCSMKEKAVRMAPIARYLVDEDSKWHLMDPIISYDKHFQVYYDHRYSRQRCGIQQYFSEVRQNLQRLVDQVGFFNAY